MLGTGGRESIRDTSATVGTACEDDVRQRPISGKQEGHLFSGIRTLLRFIRDRGVAVAEFNRALEALVMLKKKKAPVVLDPKPIERADWDALFAAAEGDDKAMILLMLNGALYIEEVRRLEWGDFRDDCLITRRNKTGQHLRVAPLWDETIEALKAVKRRNGSDRLFFNYADAPIPISGAQRPFIKLGVRYRSSQRATDGVGDFTEGEEKGSGVFDS